MLNKKLLSISLLSLSAVLSSSTLASQGTDYDDLADLNDSPAYVCPWTSYAGSIMDLMDKDSAAESVAIEKARAVENKPANITTPVNPVIAEKPTSTVDEHDLWCLNIARKSKDPEMIFSIYSTLRDKGLAGDAKAAYLAGRLYIHGFLEGAYLKVQKDQEILAEREKEDKKYEKIEKNITSIMKKLSQNPDDKAALRRKLQDLRDQLPRLSLSLTRLPITIPAKIPVLQKDDGILLLKQALQLGSAEAAYFLGNLYEQGVNTQLYTVDKNLDLSFQYYLAGSQLRNMLCMFNTGKLMINSPIATQEQKAYALSMIAEAANNNCLQACYALGKAYQAGTFFSAPDPYKAIRYYLQILSSKNVEFIKKLDIDFLIEHLGLMNYEQKNIIYSFVENDDQTITSEERQRLSDKIIDILRKSSISLESVPIMPIDSTILPAVATVTDLNHAEAEAFVADQHVDKTNDRKRIERSESPPSMTVTSGSTEGFSKMNKPDENDHQQPPVKAVKKRSKKDPSEL